MKIAEFVTRANVYKNVVLAVEVLFYLSRKNLDISFKLMMKYLKSFLKVPMPKIYLNFSFGMEQ